MNARSSGADPHGEPLTAPRLPVLARSDLKFDRTTLLLVATLIDDILEALELWQATGDVDGQWVSELWSRRVSPWIGLELPPPVRAATNTAGQYRALLAWQDVIIEQLD